MTAVPESVHVHRVIKGIAAQCGKYGYDLAVIASMVSDSGYFKDFIKGEQDIYGLTDYSLFDGVILDGISLITGDDTRLILEQYEKIRRAGSCPVFNIGMPAGDIPTLENSNDILLRQICRHAIEVHGCKKFCILTGHKGNHEAEERLSVMKDEIEKHALKVDDEHIVYGDFWYDSGNQLGRDILDKKISMPDAILAASDHMALGVIDTLTKGGIRVPEDIKVLGFDATQEASLADISLTTIESNFAKCGADAVDRIRAVIEPGEKLIPYEFDEAVMMHMGRSCGCREDVDRIIGTIKTSLYYTSRNYTDDVYKDNIDVGLMMENYIPERLASASDPAQCIRSIYETSYIISPFTAFYLCLKKDWCEDDADISAGYPDKMELVLARSNNGGMDFCDKEGVICFDAQQMLPKQLWDNDEPSVIYFSAVHFEDKALGYAVLKRKINECEKFNLVYRNWLRFVNTALEMVRSKTLLKKLSIHDKLTGLLNRRGMYDAFERMKTSASEDMNIYACVIDMDGLKFINDSFGHNEGDKGIKIVGKAVAAVTGKNEICVRSGGDEFCIIGIGRYDDKICREKEKRFSEVLEVLSGELSPEYDVCASIGGVYEQYSRTADIDQLLKEADAKMYEDKLRKKKQRV